MIKCIKCCYKANSFFTSRFLSEMGLFILHNSVDDFKEKFESKSRLSISEFSESLLQEKKVFKKNPFYSNTPFIYLNNTCRV